MLTEPVVKPTASFIATRVVFDPTESAAAPVFWFLIRVHLIIEKARGTPGSPTGLYLLLDLQARLYCLPISGKQSPDLPQ
jgi:hypothetical protein